MGGACGNVSKKRHVYKFVVGKPEETNHLEDLYVDVKIMLKMPVCEPISHGS
jgi:hypothetical protein